MVVEIGDLLKDRLSNRFRFFYILPSAIIDVFVNNSTVVIYRTGTLMLPCLRLNTLTRMRGCAMELPILELAPAGTDL